MFVGRIITRRSDGKKLRASHPDPRQGENVADMFRGDMFYFRGIGRNPRRWWRPFGGWKDTGEIWLAKWGELIVE